MGNRRRNVSVAVASALAAAAIAPAASQADVYCVATSGGDCTSTQPDVQTALNLAGASGIPDTVRVGPGTQTATATGFDISGGQLTLVGAGAGQTTLTMPASAGGNNVLSTNGGGGITVSDLRLLIPTPIGMEQYRGIDANSLDVTRVKVEAPVVFNGFGIAMYGGTVDDTTIDLPNDHAPPTNRGLTTADPVTVTDTTITADEGILHAGDTGDVLTMARTTVDAASFGVQVQTGAADLSDSLIKAGNSNTTASRMISVGNPNGILVAQASPVTVDGLTLVANELNPTIGVEVFTNENPAFIDDNSAAIRNTIFAPGVDFPIRRAADEGSQAVVTTAFSDLDAGANLNTNDSNGDTTASGLGSITSLGGDVNVTPGFVNPAGGNFHLLSTSPLIDIGDPAAPAPGSLDLDGDARSLDGIFDCTVQARRDIGADEVVGPTGVPDACTLTPVNPSTFNQVTPGPGPAQPAAKKCKKPKKKSKASAAAKKCKRKKRK